MNLCHSALSEIERFSGLKAESARKLLNDFEQILEFCGINEDKFKNIFKLILDEITLGLFNNI